MSIAPEVMKKESSSVVVIVLSLATAIFSSVSDWSYCFCLTGQPVAANRHSISATT